MRRGGGGSCTGAVEEKRGPLMTSGTLYRPGRHRISLRPLSSLGTASSLIEGAEIEGAEICKASAPSPSHRLCTGPQNEAYPRTAIFFRVIAGSAEACAEKTDGQSFRSNGAIHEPLYALPAGDGVIWLDGQGHGIGLSNLLLWSGQDEKSYDWPPAVQNSTVRL
jgi:hypothetical protein